MADIFYCGRKEAAEITASDLFWFKNKMLVKGVKDMMCAELIANSL